MARASIRASRTINGKGKGKAIIGQALKVPRG
jgi:hypothetical protein